MARILIVDDDADIVSLLTRALQTAGHEVHSAAEPSTGLEKARQVQPDLVVLDYHMPGSTGAHLFETFRRNQATGRTPILFLSGVATRPKIRSEIAEDGQTRFLAKPVRISVLRDTIREMLAS